MTLKQTFPLALAVLALAVSTSCAKRDQLSPVATPTPAQLESSFQTPTPVPPFPTPEPTPHRNSYIVRKGDTLWGIAGDPAVQGDSFRWPLLFRANRDQIIDPDLIEPDQDLTWKENYSTDEIKDAVNKAHETPPYVPHSSPRKQLPLKY